MLTAIKLEFRIEGDEDDGLLEQYIRQGKARLNSLAGGELNFDDEDTKTLLINYVRYAYNQVPELFLENFSDEVAQMQINYALGVMKRDSN